MPEVSSLAELVRSHGIERPHEPALTGDGRTVTFGELDARSNQVAQALAAYGVGSGDRVAVLDTNSIEHFEVLFGGAKLGAVYVAISWRLAPGEIAEIVNDAEAQVFIVGAAFADLLPSMVADLPRVKNIVVIGDDERYESYASWVASADQADPGSRPSPDQTVMQLYTSGTTGLPKGVMLTEHNLHALMEGSGPVLDLTRDSVNLVVLPLFHIGGSGYALIGFFAGCHTVLVRQVVPTDVLRQIGEHRVTNTYVAAVVLQMLLQEPELPGSDLSSLRTVSYGASPISVEVLTRSVRSFGCDFVQVYGLTETTGTVTLLDAEDHRRALAGIETQRLLSAGRPMPGAEVRIVSTDTGADAETGQVGEVWLRSPQVTVGYWNKPEETAAALTDDGWLRTGDAGHVDAEGYLFIQDRIKDMIITGAENVYPAQVENVLMGHPDVAQVAVIGVPSERWGETVLAVVVPLPGRQPTADALIAFSRDRLAHFKCPTSVTFVEELPRNASGKVLKRVLRQTLQAS